MVVTLLVLFVFAVGISVASYKYTRLRAKDTSSNNLNNIQKTETLPEIIMIPEQDRPHSKMLNFYYRISRDGTVTIVEVPALPQ